MPNSQHAIKRSPITVMKDVIFALLLREMRTRFGKRRMGAFWLLFEPIVHIGALMFIRGVIRGREVPGMDFATYLLTGLVPFFLMRNIIFRLMDSIDSNRALFAYPHIKIFDTYVARVIVECVLSACVYGIMIFILGFWVGYDVSIAFPLEWLAALANGVLFAIALGILFSILTQAMPNIKTFIRILFLPLYLISGVIWPIWRIPQEYMSWVLWNPFLHIISNIRSAIFITYPEVYGISYLYPMSVTFIFMFVALGLFRLRQPRLLIQIN